MPKIPKGYKYIGGLVNQSVSDQWDEICFALRTFDKRDLFGAAILNFLELARTDTNQAVQKAQEYLLHKKDPAGPPAALRASQDKKSDEVIGELLAQKVMEALSSINWSELMAAKK